MDPIEAWVDAQDLRRMAAALLAEPSSTPPDDCLFGTDFVGYGPESRAPAGTADDEVSLPARGAEESARRALSAARDLAQRGGLLEAAADSGRGEPVEPVPAADLTEVVPMQRAEPAVAVPSQARLQVFGDWLRSAVGASYFFVIDRSGGVLIDEVKSPKIHRIACTLAQASYSTARHSGGPEPGNLHAKISADAVLEVVPVNSSSGPLILGIIVPRSLDSSQAETVARGLRQVIHAAEETGTP